MTNLLRSYTRIVLLLNLLLAACVALAFLLQCCVPDNKPIEPTGPIPSTPEIDSGAVFENPFDSGPKPNTEDAATSPPPVAKCDFVELRAAPRLAPKKVPRIVGGVPVAAREFPSSVSFQSPQGAHYCTGSLLSPSVALTAGHCSPRPGERVVWGCEDLRSPSCQSSTIKRAIRFSSFNSETLDWDVSLVLLDQPADAPPIAILQLSDLCPADAVGCSAPNDPLSPGTPIVAAGWGVTTEGGYQTSPKLLKVNLELIAWSECRGAYPDLTGRMVCADENKKGSCQGDSGGPAMLLTPNGYRLAADVSFGVGCARPEWPGVYGNLLVMRPSVLACQTMLETEN
jgi:trypsin